MSAPSGATSHQRIGGRSAAGGARGGLVERKRGHAECGHAGASPVSCRCQGATPRVTAPRARRRPPDGGLGGRREALSLPPRRSVVGPPRKCRCPLGSGLGCRWGSLAVRCRAVGRHPQFSLQMRRFRRPARSSLGVVGVGALEVDGTPTDRGGHENAVRRDSMTVLVATRLHEAPARVGSTGRRSRSHGGFTVWPVGVGGRRYGRRSRSFDLWSPAPRGHPHSSPGAPGLDPPTRRRRCRRAPRHRPGSRCVRLARCPRPSETTARGSPRRPRRGGRS